MSTIRSRRESFRVSCSKLVSRIKAFPFSQLLFSSPTRIQQSSGTSTPETRSIEYYAREGYFNHLSFGFTTGVAPRHRRGQIETGKLILTPIAHLATVFTRVVALDAFVSRSTPSTTTMLCVYGIPQC